MAEKATRTGQLRGEEEAWLTQFHHLVESYAASDKCDEEVLAALQQLGKMISEALMSATRGIQDVRMYARIVLLEFIPKLLQDAAACASFVASMEKARSMNDMAQNNLASPLFTLLTEGNVAKSESASKKELYRELLFKTAMGVRRKLMTKEQAREE